MDSRQLEAVVDKRDLGIIMQNNLNVSSNVLKWLIQLIEC